VSGSIDSEQVIAHLDERPSSPAEAGLLQGWQRTATVRASPTFGGESSAALDRDDSIIFWPAPANQEEISTPCATLNRLQEYAEIQDPA